MLTLRKLFYFGKSKKFTKKILKDVILYFLKLNVRVFVDYANTVSAQSLPTWTHAEIVVDYADTMSALTLTMWTLLENFEGLTQI